MHTAIADEGLQVFSPTDCRWAVTSLVGGLPDTTPFPENLYDDEHVGATPAQAARRQARAWKLDPGNWPDEETDARPPGRFLAFDDDPAADPEAAGGRVERDLAGLTVRAVPGTSPDVATEPALVEAVRFRRVCEGPHPSPNWCAVRPAVPERLPRSTT